MYHLTVTSEEYCTADKVGKKKSRDDEIFEKL
jgi:hypothetical protein